VPANFRQHLVRVLAIGVLHAAGPERLLVQQHALLRDAAEQHAAQPPVADGQRFKKRRRRLAKSDGERRMRWESFRPGWLCLRGDAECTQARHQKESGEQARSRSHDACMMPFDLRDSSGKSCARPRRETKSR
jgi:hypothetical protein